MCENVARAQVFHKKLFNRQNRIATAEIDHDRNIGQLTSFYRAVSRGPVMAVEVCQLDPYNVFGVFFGHFGGCRSVHILYVLLISSAPHTFPNDIQEREYTCPRNINGLFFEIGKRFPACAACINHRSDPGTESKSVWGKGIWAVAVSLVHFGAVKIMGMNVDQSWGNVQTFCIHNLSSFFGVNVFGDTHDRVTFHRHVHDLIDIVFRVDQMSAFDNHTVFLCIGSGNDCECTENG